LRTQQGVPCEKIHSIREKKRTFRHPATVPRGKIHSICFSIHSIREKKRASRHPMGDPPWDIHKAYLEKT
jgi:hypothetical protein